MLHIVRDFITLANVNLTATTLYLEAIFLRAILNFSLIGNTGLPLDSVSYNPGSGTNGSLTATGGFTNRFTPDGYTVSASDINRILAIRSVNNPTLTSGIWRVTGVDTANNQFILGLRGEPPVAEAGLQWRLYVAENTLSWNNGTNSLTGQYRGRTSGSNTVRIILQSPHSSAWQVRLTWETGTDYSSSLTVRTKSTIAPGFGGDSIGDFQPGGQHLHGALFFNTSTVNYAGTVAGINPVDSNGMCRYYFWGEDSTGSTVIITRNVDTGNSANNIAAFGLPEDEQYPDDPQAVRRLFVYGCDNIFNGGTGDVNFRSGFAQTIGHTVVGFGYSGQPIVGGVSPMGYISGQRLQGDGPRFSGNGSDNPIIALTELLTVDIVLGTWDASDFAGQNQNLILEPRRLGRFPIARMGRSNFGNWTTSTDANRTWFHTLNGVYMPWRGSILP